MTLLPSKLTLTREGYMLCYVEGPWAYFADREPGEMWGDDWNDAPHECNAGTPYDHKGEKVVKVAYDGDWEIAGAQNGVVYGAGESRYGMSVEEINRGDAPWLYQPSYGLPQYPQPQREIPAGVALKDFRKLIAEAGGSVYEVRR